MVQPAALALFAYVLDKRDLHSSFSRNALRDALATHPHDEPA